MSSVSENVQENNPSMSKKVCTNTRTWCFTLFEFDETTIANMEHWPDRKYLVVGEEVCPETKKHHLQGYVMFSTMKRFTAVKKIHGTGHWEMARGTWKENFTYCTKDGNWLEFGERPKTREEVGEMEKKRWEDARALALEGRFEEIPGDLYVRYQSSFKRMRTEDVMKGPSGVDSLDNWWYVGPTGAGKSREARKLFGGDLYLKNKTKWWDGYTGQKTVLIDDFGMSNVDMIDDLKVWTDHYSFNAEFKGGMFVIRPERIVVTSNYTIQQIFGRDKEGWMLPILRRFKVKFFETVDLDDTVVEQPKKKRNTPSSGLTVTLRNPRGESFEDL